MRKGTNSYGHKTFSADVPSHTAPPISKEIQKDGKRMYKLVNGHLQDADKYDALWNPPKGKILPSRSKGPSVTKLNPYGK